MVTNLSGYIIMIDFSPAKGHEQMKRRPALVVNNKIFGEKCNMSIVLPISHAVDYPLHIDLPSGLKTDGKVLCEHIRSMDLSAREYEVIECLNDSEEGKAFLNRIRKIVCNCIME